MIAEPEEIKNILEKHDYNPNTGANESSFEMFSDWYTLCRDRKTDHGEKLGNFDVESLIVMYDEDLWNYWKSVENIGDSNAVHEEDV